MRQPLEKLARKIAKDDLSQTLGELAQKHDEPLGRIVDAMDMLKLLEGMVALDEAPITYAGETR